MTAWVILYWMLRLGLAISPGRTSRRLIVGFFRLAFRVPPNTAVFVVYEAGKRVGVGLGFKWWVSMMLFFLVKTARGGGFGSLQPTVYEYLETARSVDRMTRGLWALARFLKVEYLFYGGRF